MVVGFVGTGVIFAPWSEHSQNLVGRDHALLEQDFGQAGCRRVVAITEHLVDRAAQVAPLVVLKDDVHHTNPAAVSHWRHPRSIARLPDEIVVTRPEPLPMYFMRISVCL